MALLEVRDLRTWFDTPHGTVRAVDGVSFDVPAGDVLAIVGESGSGKSVTALSLLGLVPTPPGRVVSGRARMEGTGDLLAMSEKELLRVRGRRVAMIFQDPMSSLNPFLTIGRQLTEGLERHLGLGRAEARERAVELLEQVEIPGAARRLDDHPHQYSGGMRQRVMIAMALACEPDLLVADEPTTALDVTIQAQILRLLHRLRRERGLSIILITHDLGVVAGMADRVAVMYAGRIVEEGSCDDVFEDPLHPYTRGLLESVPRLDEARAERLVPVPGTPPDLHDPPVCCMFHPRCPEVMDVCREKAPDLVPGDEADRPVACFLHHEETRTPFDPSSSREEATS